MSRKSELLAEEESLDLLGKIFPCGLESPDLRRELQSAGWQPATWDSPNEFGRLMGQCAWDILSDNHELRLPDGRIVYLSSMRGTADIIASLTIDAHYMDFYMGTVGKDKSLLLPIYRYIFGNLRQLGIDWIYRIPRVDVLPVPQLEGDQPETFEDYDPSVSFAVSEAEREEQEMLAKLGEVLKRDAAEIAPAENKPPPETVRAYFDVFGKWPEGWPA
jgi:hypothetical protein